MFSDANAIETNVDAIKSSNRLRAIALETTDVANILAMDCALGPAPLRVSIALRRRASSLKDSLLALSTCPKRSNGHLSSASVQAGMASGATPFLPFSPILRRAVSFRSPPALLSGFFEFRCRPKTSRDSPELMQLLSAEHQTEKFKASPNSVFYAVVSPCSRSLLMAYG